jgi:hypothetical protein
LRQVKKAIETEAIVVGGKRKAKNLPAGERAEVAPGKVSKAGGKVVWETGTRRGRLKSTLVTW